MNYLANSEKKSDFSFHQKLSLKLFFTFHPTTELIIYHLSGIFHVGNLVKMTLWRCVNYSSSPIFTFKRAVRLMYSKVYFLLCLFFGDFRDVVNSAKIKPHEISWYMVFRTDSFFTPLTSNKQSIQLLNSNINKRNHPINLTIICLNPKNQEMKQHQQNS